VTELRDDGALLPPLSPAALFWRRFRRSPLAVWGGALLVVLYGLALFAPFVAPYAENDIDRERFYHPPTPVRWVDARGCFHPGGFVYGTVRDGANETGWREDRSRVLPLRWFARGAPWRWLGLVPSDRHLFGVEAPGRVFVFGADALGRDLLSRVLYGAQVSMTVGLVGIAISFGIGLLLGAVSGYFGGAVDEVLMRVTELVLSVPGLYLIVALRAVFPASLPSRQVYLAIVVILAFLGWAGLARVIRGMVLGLRRSEYVLAAEALGMSRWRVIVRHILPNTMTFVIVAATVAVPGYILGEVFLSFLGMGVQEPAASWGNMLAQARSLSILRTCAWMLYTPAVAIFLTVMAFNLFGDGLRDALDPRGTPGGRA
jgi:peptide/nickel transport system permease protein